MTLENAEGLATIAQEIGADVIRGEVRYPSNSGDIEVAGVDIGEYLFELKNHEVVVIVAALGLVGEHPVICGLCLTPSMGSNAQRARQKGKRRSE